MFLIKIYQQQQQKKEIETDGFVVSLVRAAVALLTFLMWKNLI